MFRETNVRAPIKKVSKAVYIKSPVQEKSVLSQCVSAAGQQANPSAIILHSMPRRQAGTRGWRSSTMTCVCLQNVQTGGRLRS